MTPPSGYTEDVLVEQPAIALLAATQGKRLVYKQMMA